MRRTGVVAALAAALTAVVVSVGVNLLEDGPGPIPTCNGEQATLVLDGAGLTPEDDEWGFAVGTFEHDVIVATIPSQKNGIRTNTDFEQAPAAGDFVCGTNKSERGGGVRGSDQIYAGTGDDWISTAGGNDIIYAGKGRDVVFTGAGEDRVWLFHGGDMVKDTGGRLHTYLGRSPAGAVIVGGKPTRAQACVVPGQSCIAGDHIHPCGLNEQITVAEAEERYDIDVTGIEYVGPDPAGQDPCSYQ